MIRSFTLPDPTEMDKRRRKDKILRIRDGGLPSVLDLFAGCGGLSLGFLSAGHQICGSVEIDPVAARTHATNFCKHMPENTRQLHTRPRDITQEDPRQTVAELTFALKRDSVDIIIGGPPCQAFARVGRAKLREIAEHPEAFLKDPRSNLYLAYLDYVRELQPVALLVENVPDVLNYGGHNVAEEMCQVLSEMGYVCGYTLLNSAFFGIPQMRERMFLMAFSEEVGAEICFPAPSTWMDLPKGYYGSRQVALKYLSLNHDLFTSNRYYIEPPEPCRSLAPAVTAFEALCDLPPITLHLEGKLRRGPRIFNKEVPYRSDLQPSDYGRLMRNWPGFENNRGIKDHVIRSLPRDYAIFRRMKAGDQYPEACQVAMQIFEEEIRRLRLEGIEISQGCDEYEGLKKKIVPPYDPGKFPNKWRKMEPHLPARTLLAHLGKDGYSHIHYDSDQARTISVREAARLQSFPDGFVFHGTMNPAFRQIGNAVPPLMGFVLAKTMLHAIRGTTNVRKNGSQATHGFGSDLFQMAF